MDYVPSENERRLLAAYAGEFSDGTPRGWVLKESEHDWEITFPNTATVSTSQLGDPTVWGSTPGTDANTTVLWRNSLAYIPRLLKLKSGVKEVADVEKIIESFLEWFENTATTDIKSLKSGSQDHQSALRIRTLLWILSLLLREERMSEFDRILSLYSRLLTIENRLLNELDLYQPNNHGIMLGIAHLHTETLLPDLLAGPDAQAWVGRLYSTLGEIIDEDGIASENTPIYQVFYVMLLEDVVAFVDWSGKFSGRARMFQMLLRAAQIGVRKQLLPTGAVPPLGDSPGGMQHRFKPMLGTLWSPNNGLAVLSSESEYLSFIAGFRSVIHKQLDDLSISWWKNGEFIFRDAGLLSYDQDDPIAVGMRGPGGHSLPTYSQFDSWTTKNSISYGKNSSRLRGKLTSRKATESSTEFTAEILFDGKNILQRHVRLEQDDALKITDMFTATGYGVPIIRFLLDPSIQVVRESEGNLVLSRKNLTLSARFTTSQANGDLNIDIRESYVAMEHHKLAKTKEIVITFPNHGGAFNATSTFNKIES